MSVGGGGGGLSKSAASMIALASACAFCASFVTSSINSFFCWTKRLQSDSSAPLRRRSKRSSSALARWSRVRAAPSAPSNQAAYSSSPSELSSASPPWASQASRSASGSGGGSSVLCSIGSRLLLRAASSAALLYHRAMLGRLRRSGQPPITNLPSGRSVYPPSGRLLRGRARVVRGGDEARQRGKGEPWVAKYPSRKT